LSTAINIATSRVPQPNGTVPLGTAWPRREPQPGSAWGGWPGDIGVLGSGSDYTAFLHHWGVPSAHMTFDGNYGVYHSVYDSFTWMEKWGDKDFVYSEALTKLWGTLALVLSEPEKVGLGFNDTASALHKYFAHVNQSTEKRLDLSALHTAIGVYSTHAKNLTAVPDRLDVVNGIIRRAERNFLIAGGLPGRPYFKHVLQAPGIYLGYGSDVFPGLTEAIRDKNWTLAQQQANVLASVIRLAGDSLAMPAVPKGGADAFLIVGIAVGILALLLGILCCYRHTRKVQTKGYSPIE